MEQDLKQTLLGQLLLARGAITPEQLAQALARQKLTGEQVGQILLQMQALSANELEAALRAQRRLRGEVGRDGQNVLVVDDDPEVGAVIGETLARAGLRAGVAENAAEALAVLGASDGERPALVILDLCLPGLGGIDILAAIRGDAATAKIPVLVLTGRPDLEDEIVARGLAVNAVLHKPMPPLRLLAEVEGALREARGAG